ncbi:hypothetical protein AVEN_170731-1 [Araneus ventricosus]|uniref:Uncharacterized protein n=1 Tax=Araneus ventricosus TaxID=182803 RepID=A0A4Y2VK40_ARAVE|nr:hypothetical protein AVEN_170731-1 [Araneus ventricosus]
MLSVSDTCPSSIFPRKFKILMSSSERHVTSLSEQITVKYHIQRSEFSAQQQLLFTCISSRSARASIKQDPDGPPPTDPLPPTTAADHLIPRTETIQHPQRTITGDPKNYLLNSPCWTPHTSMMEVAPF